MKKETKIKIFLGLSYLLIILGFLWVLVNKFSIEEITSYEFIKNNKYFLNELKEGNFFSLSIYFFFIFYNLGSAFRICITSAFAFRIYFWKIYRVNLRNLRTYCRSDTSLYFCKFFFQGFYSREIF